MSHRLGKIKQIRNTIVLEGESVDPEFIIGETIDTNLYDDITSIENWDIYGLKVCTDFLQVRSRIVDEINIKGGWTGLTNTEKDVCITYCALATGVSINDDNMNKVIYLTTTKGLSQPQAMGYLLQAFAQYNSKEIECCSKRITSSRLFETIGMFLSTSDGADFVKITQNLAYLYQRHAIMGVNEGVSGEGLFDFIQSTPGTQYEFAGLAQQGYTINNGTITDLINGIMDVLKNGNY